MSSKVIIVTGASRGIGLAIASYLLKASHNVVLAARSRDQLDALKKSYPNQVEYVAGDMGNFEVSENGSHIGMPQSSQEILLYTDTRISIPLTRRLPR